MLDEPNLSRGAATRPRDADSSAGPWTAWLVVLLYLDPRIVNGKAREVAFARFTPITQVKVRP
jgi:hypothetical protein